MQAIEIVVFFMVAIISGSLIIVFITGLDPGKLFQDIRGMIFPDSVNTGDIPKVTYAKFHDYVYKCWLKCEAQENLINCGTVYISDGNSMSAESLTNNFRKYNFCMECTVEVQGEPLELPAIVKVECENGKITVKG